MKMRGAFLMPAKKDKNIEPIRRGVKMEAIRLHIEEKWTYRRITEHLEIQDKGRVKRWMRKYREQGEFGLLDQRGRREEYKDQDRYVQQLKRENQMLKKGLEIWKQEGNSPIKNG
jgi:transposase-like protein